MSKFFKDEFLSDPWTEFVLDRLRLIHPDLEYGGMKTLVRNVKKVVNKYGEMKFKNALNYYVHNYKALPGKIKQQIAITKNASVFPFEFTKIVRLYDEATLTESADHRRDTMIYKAVNGDAWICESKDLLDAIIESRANDVKLRVFLSDYVSADPHNDDEYVLYLIYLAVRGHAAVSLVYENKTSAFNIGKNGTENFKV